MMAYAPVQLLGPGALSHSCVLQAHLGQTGSITGSTHGPMPVLCCLTVVTL